MCSSFLWWPRRYQGSLDSPCQAAAAFLYGFPHPSVIFQVHPCAFAICPGGPILRGCEKARPSPFLLLCVINSGARTTHTFFATFYIKGGTRSSSIRLLLLFLTAVEPNAWAPCAKRPPSSWAYFVPGPTCKNVCSSILCRVVYVCAETARQSMQFEKRALCTWMEPSSHWAFIEKFLIGIVICKFVIV